MVKFGQKYLKKKFNEFFNQLHDNENQLQIKMGFLNQKKKK